MADSLLLAAHSTGLSAQQGAGPVERREQMPRGLVARLGRRPGQLNREVYERLQRAQATAIDANCPSGSSPTNLCQLAQRSRRSWLTLPAEILNERAT